MLGEHRDVGTSFIGQTKRSKAEQYCTRLLDECRQMNELP